MAATLFVRRFTDTDRVVQAFAVFPSALLVVTERSVQSWQERDGELARLEDIHLAAPILLALTHLQQNNLSVLLTAISNIHSGLWTYSLSWVSNTSKHLPQIAVTVPQLLNGGGDIVKRETMPQASQPVLMGASSDGLLCSASLYQGWVHVMSIPLNHAPVSCDKVVTALHSFCEDAAEQFQGVDCRVQSMAFESTAVHQETIFLMCLVCFTGFNHSCKEIHCLDVNLSQPNPLKDGVKAGPWVLRNVDPSTTLLHAISSGKDNNKGVLAVSSQSIHLLSAASANSHPVLTFRLAGLPTAIVHVKGSMWALADSMAGLHLLDLRQPCTLLQLTPQIPLTVAHVLCCVPGSDADLGVGANLFLGSRTANSQLASLPAALLNQQADRSTSQLSAHQSLTSSQASASVTVQKPAMIDSAAPIHDACVFQEPKGCGEWRMVMGCGVAPRGSLRLAHLAAKLTPTISGGPCMPGRPRLMAIKAGWQQEHHAYLAFSFPTEGTTSVLDIQGTHFQPIHLPGLNPNSPSLLLEALPGGWLVQVTPEEVRVLDNTGLIGAWGSVDTLSMAASCGSLIAAAHGTSITLVNVDAANGEPSATKTLHYSEQVSAVALLKMPHAVAAEEPEHWLIVGLWTEDTVILQRLSDDQDSCTLDCSDVGQPRSILAAEMHGTWFLFVGTSQGWVIYHAITWQAGKMQLEGGCKVHAGMSGARLSYLPSHSSTPACLYVQSSKALLLRPAASNKASGNKADLVEAVRMHGGEGVMGGVGVHTLDLPNSLAWLSPKEQLTFGDVDHTMQLRWFTLGLEDTPGCVAYHTTSGHAAVLSTSPSGASWLRLVHATTLTQVVALQLGKGHTATAICCARLPSSSVTAIHHLPGLPPAEKEFVVVASYVSQPKASQGSQAGPAHTPSQGLLSVFEVCTAGTAGQTASAANNRSQIRLHGTCRLQSLCYSLATTPAYDSALAMSKARSSHSGPEVVVAGCEGEVHLYSLFVDDTAQAGRQAVATACLALAQGEPLPDQGHASDKATSTSQGGSGQTDQSSTDVLENLASQGCTDRVHLQLLSKAATAGGSSLVTSLSTLGTTVAACSFMSSVSLFTTAGHEGKPSLEPLSANISLMTAQRDIQHDGPIQVQSAGMLNGQFLLAGAYPDGLLLLKRDVAQEEAAFQARRSAKEKALLEGTERGNVPVPISQASQQAEDADLPNVHLQAGCNIQHGATSFCRARLGVQHLPHASHLSSVDARASQLDGAQSEMSDNHMLVTTSDGKVFATSLVESDRRTGQLETLYTGADADGLEQFTWRSSLSAASVMQMQPVDVAHCVKDCMF